MGAGRRRYCGGGRRGKSGGRSGGNAGTRAEVPALKALNGTIRWGNQDAVQTPNSSPLARDSWVTLAAAITTMGAPALSQLSLQSLLECQLSDRDAVELLTTLSQVLQGAPGDPCQVGCSSRRDQLAAWGYTACNERGAPNAQTRSLQKAARRATSAGLAPGVQVRAAPRPPLPPPQAAVPGGLCRLGRRRARPAALLGAHPRGRRSHQRGQVHASLQGAREGVLSSSADVQLQCTSLLAGYCAAVPLHAAHPLPPSSEP